MSTAVDRVLARLNGARRLSFVDVAEVVGDAVLTPEAVPALLRALLDRGVDLPRALTESAAPATAPPPVGDPGTIDGSPTDEVDDLTSADVIDLAGISLTDLGLVAAPSESTAARSGEDAPGVDNDRSVPPRMRGASDSTPTGTDHSDPDTSTGEDDGTDDESDDEAVDSYWTYRLQSGKYGLLTAAEEVDLARSVEAGVLADERLNSDPPADPDLAADLRELVDQGRAARDRFLCANLRLVISIAAEQGGLDRLDLIQEGNLGLIRAVQKFDPDHGTKFSTYATWWIRQAIGRGVADQSRTIRYPVHIVEQVQKIRRIRDGLVRSGRAAGDETVAAEAGIGPDDVARLDALPAAVELQKSLHRLGERRWHELAARHSPVTREPDLGRFDVEDVREFLATLSHRELLVLERRFGFDGGEEQTLDVIGKLLGVTRERVRQIEAKVLKRLCAHLVAIKPPGSRTPPAGSAPPPGRRRRTSA